MNINEMLYLGNELINESKYYVYNTKEEIEDYGEEKPEYRREFTSEGLKNQIIGTIMNADNGENPYQQIRTCIDKMPDEWIIQFLEVINGDTVEKISD